jgi:uncharacterized protein (DUF2384 family)
MGRFYAEPATSPAGVDAVWELATEIWGSEADARSFMLEVHPLLHGRRPLDVAQDGELGPPVVESLLGRLQKGWCP